jgi:DNA-binding response OmpR family regulator
VSFARGLLKKPEDEIRLYDHVYYNIKSKTIRHKDASIKLTDQEISLLELLIHNKNTILSFNQIEYLLGSNKFLTDNAISLIISRLRKKLSMINIKTIYGQGYMLVLD